MLQDIKNIYGDKLAATDGTIGLVKDFYFDDQSWVVRYLVADVGDRLWGRLIILGRHVFGSIDRETKLFHIKLTLQKIDDGPSFEAHRPVSLQDEDDYEDYYEWPIDWEGYEPWGPMDEPSAPPSAAASKSSHHGHNQRDDRHLRSTATVAKYAIHAIDGHLGSVRSFMVDDKTWKLRELVVEAGHWYSGKEVFISTSKIERISYAESIVYVNLTKADIRATAENNSVSAGAGKDL